MRILSWFLMMFGVLSVFFGLLLWLPFVSRDIQLDFTGVFFFVILGTISYFIGTRLKKQIPPEKAISPIFNPNDITFISKALNTQKRTLFILGLSLLVFDVLIIFAATQGNEDEESLPVIIMVLVIAILILILGVAIWFLYKSFKLWNTHETYFYKKITESPHLITSLSAYFFQKEGAPGKFGQRILIELWIEGKMLDKINVSEEQLSLLKQYVQFHSPNAIYNEKKVKV